jgi:hypothetical protein
MVHIREFMLMQPKLHHQMLMQVPLNKTCVPVKKARFWGNMARWTTMKMLLNWRDRQHQSMYLKMNVFSAIHLELVRR